MTAARIRSRPYVWQPVAWSDQRVMTRGSVDGLPALTWGRADRAQLATARQLRQLGLRPAGAEPVAVLVFGHRQPGRRPVEYTSLYRIADAAPKRSATAAQREAIQRALAARRTCQECGAEQDYYLSTVSRMCGPCSDATGFWDDHDQERAAEADADDADGWWDEHEAAMRAEDRHRPVTDTDLADDERDEREIAELAEHEVHQPAEVDPVTVPAQRTTGADGPSPALATGAEDARAAVAEPTARPPRAPASCRAVTALEPLSGMPDPAEAPLVRHPALLRVGRPQRPPGVRVVPGIDVRAGARRADTSGEDLMGAGRSTKRARMRLVRTELWLHVAMTAEQWAKCCEDREPGVLPFADWPDDDALVTLCRTYSIMPADLAKECRAVAQQTEDRVIRNGYDDALDYAEGGPR